MTSLRGRISREGRTYIGLVVVALVMEEGRPMVEQLLIATGVVGALVTLAAGAFVTLALRRRCRSARERLRAIRIPTLERRGSLRPAGSAVVATIGSPSWWVVQHRRHRMWRAVSSAEHAVGVARRSDVPVGDLPMLSSQLRAAARGVDSVLRASARVGSLSHEDRADCDRIEAAAASIHDSALSSLRSVARSETGPLVSAVQVEVAALAAGVRAAHH